jgi:hypothetical protein
MARTPKQASNSKNNGSTANLGFEAKLWAAADALRTKFITPAGPRGMTVVESVAAENHRGNLHSESGRRIRRRDDDLAEAVFTFAVAAYNL